jgi:hypothetical protein
MEFPEIWHNHEDVTVVVWQLKNFNDGNCAIPGVGAHFGGVQVKQCSVFGAFSRYEFRYNLELVPGPSSIYNVSFLAKHESQIKRNQQTYEGCLHDGKSRPPGN